jgi:hypothetical protein
MCLPPSVYFGWRRNDKCAYLPALRLRCHAVPRIDSMCRWPLVVPRMEHTAPRLPFSAQDARVVSASTGNVSKHSSFLCFRFVSSCSRMFSATFWSDACRNAEKRPLPTLLVALYASCGATVRRPPLLLLGARPAHICVADCLVSV